MAEALGKKYLNHFSVESAGTDPEPINPFAIDVMKEINIDISSQFSKSISDNKIKTFDIVITLCGDAKDKCTNINNLVKEYFHWNIIDPARSNGTNQDKLDTFREVRDLIDNNMQILVQTITKSH